MQIQIQLSNNTAGERRQRREVKQGLEPGLEEDLHAAGHPGGRLSSLVGTDWEVATLEAEGPEEKEEEGERGGGEERHSGAR